MYAAMLEHEKVFGKPERKQDDFGEWYDPKSASDYMWYVYPDYYCKEFESYLIRCVAEMVYSYSNMPEGAELVALETEG